MSDKKLPILNLRQWPVEIAVWENESANGHKYYSAKLTESFKNRDGQYETSQYLNSSNFTKAAALLLEANARLVIEEREIKGRASKDDDQGPF